MAAAIEPGPIYVGNPITIYASFTDGENYSDPLSVVAKLMSPTGAVTSKVYGVDAPSVAGSDTLQFGRSSTGVYFIIITPNAGGRWRYRIEATGTPNATEGDILAMRSPFVDGLGPEAYRR